MITLKDLAKAAGVSPSAVSLVLNGRSEGRVNDETAARVRQLADDLGYVPNLLARGLKTRRSHTFGVVSHGVASVPFAGALLEGLQAAATESEYLAMIIDTAGRPALSGPSAKSLLQRDVDGMIVVAQFHRRIDTPALAPSMPLVVLNGTPMDDTVIADSVVPDETAGAYSAVQHLLEAGHRRIAFCLVDDDIFVARELRLAGYRRALADYGVPFDPSLVVTVADPSTASSRPAMRELLTRSTRPTGLFCFSDQSALAAYQVAQQLDLRIPVDLSVVGFDDQAFIAEALMPGLTTVRLPHREMGVWAGRRLIDRIRGDGPSLVEQLVMPCPLIVRASVASPPAVVH